MAFQWDEVLPLLHHIQLQSLYQLFIDEKGAEPDTMAVDCLCYCVKGMVPFPSDFKTGSTQTLLFRGNKSSISPE